MVGTPSAASGSSGLRRSAVAGFGASRRSAVRLAANGRPARAAPSSSATPSANAVSRAVAAVFCVHFLLRYFKRNNLVPFGIYCLLFGTAMIIYTSV